MSSVNSSLNWSKKPNDIVLPIPVYYSLQLYNMSSTTVSSILVDSTLSLQELLSSIENLPTSPPCLYVDLEGVRLSRHGTISLLTIFVEPLNKVYLVDIHTMKSAAFTTALSSTGTTLKSILELPTITKVFFDVRNDSDALYAHFGIHLQGIQDVQLMENASRPAYRPRNFVCGLDRCITMDAPIVAAVKVDWKAVKDKGVSLFHPSQGGTYEVFNQRPLSLDIVRYCVNDVILLPMLRGMYWAKLNAIWREKVVRETENRVKESQSTGYEPQSESKKLGPWRN